MSDSNAIAKAAEMLWKSGESKIVCEPVRELIGATDLATAYAVQAINTNKRLAAGGRKVGCKIGLTSPAVQTQLGVDQPDFGIMFADMEVPSGGRLSMRDTMQPKAEAEITFVLKADLNSDNLTLADVAAAIDYAVVSIEVAGSRVANWNIRITDTIADNASASHYVLGTNKVKLENIDLTGCTMSLTKNGEEVSTGTGAACMGSPLNAVLWLAQTMKKLGQPLKAGDIVLSGALGPMVNAVAGDHITATISGLGSAEVTFTE